MDLISIAVDGPAGSGKSTVAKQVADKLNITYLDTGAMYRMVTLKLINENRDIENISEVSEALNTISIKFIGNDLYLDNQLVSDEIRTNTVANLVAKVASIEIVRNKMVEMQREIAKGQSIIMDGRDIGTVVLRDATHKFFLTATVDERAKRRMKDFVEKNISITFDDLVKDIQERDYIDSNREISPLKQAEDAILIDTTNMNTEEVIDYIIRKVIT